MLDFQTGANKPQGKLLKRADGTPTERHNHYRGRGFVGSAPGPRRPTRVLPELPAGTVRTGWTVPVGTSSWRHLQGRHEAATVRIRKA